MSSALGRDAVLIDVINGAFNRHTGVKLLVQAYKNETQESGHANSYECRDAVDAHGYDIAGAARGVHCGKKLLASTYSLSA
jgi:hypothetical protein